MYKYIRAHKTSLNKKDGEMVRWKKRRNPILDPSPTTYLHPFPSAKVHFFADKYKLFTLFKIQS